MRSLKQYSYLQKINQIMQPLPPKTFPHRVKRFQSLSMTPLDIQTPDNSCFQTNSIFFSNKSNFVDSERDIPQQSVFNPKNPTINQHSFKNRTKLFDFYKSNSKNTFKAQLGSTNIQLYSGFKSSHFAQQQTKIMASSQFFNSISSHIKKNYSEEKECDHSINSSRNGQRKKKQQKKTINSIGQHQKKDRQFKIPSFLLNRKKQTRNSMVLPNQHFFQQNLLESFPTASHQSRTDQIIVVLKRQQNPNQNKKQQDEFQQSILSPPQNQKVIYSKATASTICTNLIRQESRKTLKEFQEMEELKQVQKQVLESDVVLYKEFDNLFKKQESPVSPNLENQIAELFSDEEAESQQLNLDLREQLQRLF